MANLQAGAATIDITPPLGCHMCGYFNDRVAADIHDPLSARAIVLDDGDVRLALVVCDLIDIPADVVLASKARIARDSGIPPEHVLISATHTHTGPSIVGALGTPREEEYGQYVSVRMADTVALALNRMQPAEMAFTAGSCPEEVHNRRWHMRDGSVRMNPGYANSDRIRPAGPTDPELGLMILRTPERRPIAVLANLALHYVGATASTWISADYFAEFGRALQRCAGAEFVAIMTNGCQGNVNNCDFTNPPRTHPHAYFQVERVANVVAAEAWRVWNLLREDAFTTSVPLQGRLTMLPFQARSASAEELCAAERLLAGEANPTDTEWVYARELVLVSQGPAEWDVAIQALRLGDLGVVAFPGEVFCEFGLDAKARSPFAQTMVVGIANGSIGYVATDQALAEGSYETRLCRHVRAPKGTGQLWVDTATDLLASTVTER